MNVNDLKANDRIRTTFEYYLACKTRVFLKSKKTDSSLVSYISNDYVILSEYYNHDYFYIFLNAEKIESTSI